MVSKKTGKILNISSMWGRSGASCEAAYSASKAGIHGLTQALAKELAPSNIQVNAIAFGVIDTAMNQMLDPDERLALQDEIPCRPLRRTGRGRTDDLTCSSSAFLYDWTNHWI
mgnify:CR=1 FL=1